MKLKKHLGLLAAVVIVSSGANSVVGCGSTQQEAPKPLTLFSELKQTNLGDFLNTPSNKEIMHRLGKVNPGLDLDSLKIIDHQSRDRRVIVKSLALGRYIPETRTELTYHLGAGERRQNLPDLFKTTYLGVFSS